MTARSASSPRRCYAHARRQSARCLRAAAAGRGDHQRAEPHARHAPGRGVRAAARHLPVLQTPPDRGPACGRPRAIEPVIGLLSELRESWDAARQWRRASRPRHDRRPARPYTGSSSGRARTRPDRRGTLGRAASNWASAGRARGSPCLHARRPRPAPCSRPATQLFAANASAVAAARGRTARDLSRVRRARQAVRGVCGHRAEASARRAPLADLNRTAAASIIRLPHGRGSPAQGRVFVRFQSGKEPLCSFSTPA